ncbi:SDR family NAD(P)-dependent oxidoreductase [Corallococcus carmarthensis]|uniref:SDR family oxidoreductase n=1 Tax=Corallococcus carmarthensis TaxID=2316728 RepID=A0A3A8K5C3_9BACT|nr:SDR family oxidoreductase [Corallococcus carmarthensis]NOK18115.1 SDR family oxidoreductase [Corallococcus carmarthensis]RKG97641.1 SDR family oxidoreductase [Corallococcus carmarthensis]
MELGLANKVALIAGGSSGLGLAVAEELAKEGAHVAIGARDTDRLAQAEARLKSVARGGRVLATRVDVKDDAEVRRWVDDVVAKLGALHVVVTNSGGPPPGPASTFGVDAYRSAADAVLLPPISLALAALPHLKAAGWGRVLFITSETVHRPVARFALSGFARMGIVGFSAALVQELGDSGITVNVLAPGYMRTPPVERTAGGAGDVEAGLRAMGAHIPLKRVGLPEEFAAAAVFLASERASFITGTVQLVDGGASVIG